LSIRTRSGRAVAAVHSRFNIETDFQERAFRKRDAFLFSKEIQTRIATKMETGINEVKKIPVKSQDEVWFFQKQINLFDILEFFPADAVGTADGKEGKKLTIDTDLGWSFETDIEKGKFCFRKKSKSTLGTGRWVIESRLVAGDNICIEKLGEYHYKLYREEMEK
jgi:hypothetical protein